MSENRDKKVVIDPRLPVVLDGLLSALPDGRGVLGSRKTIHQAVSGLMHECVGLTGIATFRKSGFSPEVGVCLEKRSDITFDSGRISISRLSIGSQFKRYAQEHFDSEVVAQIRQHAGALRGRLT